MKGSMPQTETFVATEIELVDHRRLIPADYNPREMDARTLRVLVRSLVRFGWVLPVVANRRTGNIVGGHQRARANHQVLKTQPKAKAKHYQKVPVIYVDLSIAEEKALNVALNQISGDWDFFKRAAADELRQNATFAQMTRRHHRLGKGYLAPLGLKRFELRDPEHLRAFTRIYGTRILDFGCGRGQEIEWLSEIGITAKGFEPFRRVPRSDRLCVDLSRSMADQFLDALSHGYRPETVFCNFVISSIASPVDRRHVLTLLQALGTRARSVVVAVRSTDDVHYQEILGRVRCHSGAFLGVPDASEPGLIVTGAGTTRQKFQKFFDEGEFRRLLRRHFRDVEVTSVEKNDTSIVGICRSPKPPNRRSLERAIRFEFDLRINDERMDRAERALRTFDRWMQRK